MIAFDTDMLCMSRQCLRMRFVGYIQSRSPSDISWQIS